MKNKGKIGSAAVIGAIGLVAALSIFLSSRLSDADRAMTGKLLQSMDKVATFEGVNSEPWDVVCYLDPYDMPARRMQVYLPEGGRDLSFTPSGSAMGEEEGGLVFVNRATKVARVFVIEHTGIHRIEGPRCLERPQAYFAVDRIDALNASYTQLKLVAGQKI
ncbi:hypothetical protein E9232_003145 [Inquilinus ginsengisoli]|uniref:Transmembrane protein n=1 Tax=Inquilinus ginsengisoli TaxID=363840 RepID=A0ABU1JPS4_9PROT|nr:hypothetical protein [Inquilinus ginsengisoli]MDR6290619.1 hypothetical protein [Inquilinus ginsengisoli]